MNHIQRRRFLQTLASGASLLIPGWALASNHLWMPDDRPATPQQTEGPFYPEPSIEQQLYRDNDLRRKLGDHALALGTPIFVQGTVLNQKERPIPNAVVEIWQACATGRYNHRRDQKNPSLLDNNFQFWGRELTGQDGKYSFYSIIPGKYPGRTARHIHFRVDAAGYRRCSTQCYFSDFGEDNLRDGIYTSLDRAERQQVTIEFDKPGTQRASAAASVKLKQPTSPIGKDATRSSASSAPSDSQRAQPAQNKEAPLKVAQPWRGKFDIVLARGNR